MSATAGAKSPAAVQAKRKMGECNRSKSSSA
jgi:hypothetical protein